MAEGNVSAQQVKELREKTGAGMMDCKKALQECGGDMDAAVGILREKGFESVQKRQEKVTEQGVVESYLHIGKQIGALVEINCETDFVARNEEFLELAHEVAMQIAACNPTYLDRESVPADVVGAETEKYERETGKASSDEEVQGLLDKFFGEHCLLEQPFVRDASLTVSELVGLASAKLGEKLRLRRFARFQVGEKQE